MLPQSFDYTFELLRDGLKFGESVKLQPEVGELGRNLFVSTEKFVGGSMVVASSCWQPNIELSLGLACEFFLLERKVLLSVALS